MPPPETGKQRAQRMPLDYYKKSNRVERIRDRLGFLAVLVVGGWLAYQAATSRQPSFGASRGHVAAVHQAWNDDCTVCHVPFQATSSHSFVPAPLVAPVAITSPSKCQACHQGPEHHVNQSHEYSCGTCHRDHRGPDASLVRLPDADCTQCHTNLESNMKQPGQRVFENRVTRFAAKTHPEFRSVKSDPGKLQFNHAQHMTAGIPDIDPKTGKPGGILMTYGDLKKNVPDLYARYDPTGMKNPAEPVKLQCASCHVLDSGDFGLTQAQAVLVQDSRLPKRSPGAYFLPISYENQCRACHPLGIQGVVPGGDGFTLPHGLQPAEVVDLVENRLVSNAVGGKVGFYQQKVTRPLPGKLLTPELDATVKQVLDRDLDIALKDLFVGKRNCGECHTYIHPEGPPAAGKALFSALKIEPTRVPQVWLKHAKFDHMAHRAVDCRECHGKAYPTLADGQPNPQASTRNSDVLVPNMDNCLQCHAPKTATGGGVRFDCTGCHNYHNGDHPLAGRGAAARNAPVPGTTADFLQGKLPLEKP